MKRQRKLWLLISMVAALGGLGARRAAVEASTPPRIDAPRFEVDPFWPQPLPNHWVLGMVIGVAVDSRDHVFIFHRSTATLGAAEAGAEQDPPTAECCAGAPPILEFDPEGNLVSAWGGSDGPDYVWPTSNHGIGIDQYDNIWIGGNAGGDSHILKFTHDGRFLQQIGEPEQGGTCDSNSLTRFCGVAKISFDLRTEEAFVADGYGNRRVAVLDLNTGKIKRFWGAYGNRPVDGFNLGDRGPDNLKGRQFRGPVHCAEPSHDGLVYVCDRQNNRIQVFRRNGRFVSEWFVAPATLGDGAVWDVAFSRDPDQRFMYVADGKNMKIYVLERRSMTLLTSFGQGGRYPGQFYGVHSIATDSKGNLYTTETFEGKRVQKFNYLGTDEVAREYQPSVWPTPGR